MLNPRSLLNIITSTFFRLFPCPTRIGLRRIGKPDRNSPVLATGNFSLTVRRLRQTLKGFNIWLLVTDSGGIDVWSASCGGKLNTASIVSALKTTGIDLLVNHRKVILPPLSAPGVNAHEVAQKTGWKVHWGPFHVRDLPEYLIHNQKRFKEKVTFNWKERLDVALGVLFLPFLLGAGFLYLFNLKLLDNYLVASCTTFIFFFVSAPWLPGKNGIAKIAIPEILLGVAGLFTTNPVYKSTLIIALITLPIWGVALLGLDPYYPCVLGTFFNRLGIKKIGCLNWNNSLRIDLLKGTRKITYNPELCNRCGQCSEVCPKNLWNFDAENQRVTLMNQQLCIACNACLCQCRTNAIKVA